MLSDLTAASVPLEIRGKVYDISPLTEGDWGELCRAIQFYPFTSLKASGEASPESLQKCLMECAAKHISFDSADFLLAERSPWAKVEMAYLSLRHKLPSLTREDLASWSWSDIEEVVMVVFVLSDVDMRLTPEAKKKMVEQIKEGKKALDLKEPTPQETPPLAESLSTEKP